MDAEMVRDYALAASGLLVEKIGGPSVRPYQPPGIWNEVGMPAGRHARIYPGSRGQSLSPQRLYVLETPGHAGFHGNFQRASRETCTVRRDRTDTPLQALVTLNDPQFVEAARHLAQRTR